MMCRCEQTFGERFLSHQLRRGRDLESGLDVSVTLGFQKNICRTCRGLPEEAHPKAELHGRCSKILRYYWREIFMDTTQRFADWALEEGFSDHTEARRANPQKYAEVEKAVIEDVKALHAKSPKYTYDEMSAADVLDRYAVEIVDLKASYVHRGGKRFLEASFGVFESAEELVSAHYIQRDYRSLRCESRPMHVLFGTYMWLLIQDPTDPLRQMVGFRRELQGSDIEAGETILTFLPKDFGKPGFGRRRAREIEDHFRLLEEDLEWLFDYWLDHSSGLRQYLHAHEPDDVERARTLLGVLPRDTVIRILRYLVESYWARYVGWPDLLIYSPNGYFFAEVKGSGDKLRQTQKRWIADNAQILHLPFKLVRVHRDRA